MSDQTETQTQTQTHTPTQIQPQAAGPAPAVSPTARPEPTPERPKVVIAPRPITGPRQVATVPLRIGDAQIPVTLSGSYAEVQAAKASSLKSVEEPDEPLDVTAPDLDVVIQRCLLKVRACDLAIERLTNPSEPDKLRRMNELIVAAKQMRGCFLWMFYPGKPVPPEPILRQLSAAYANLAAAATLVHECRADSDGSRLVPSGSTQEFDAIMALAEAQSALRVLLEAHTWIQADNDQNDAFGWLREISEWERVYIGRFMRLDDAADPAGHEDLRRRILEMTERVRAQRAERSKFKKLRDKVRYHARRITPDASGGDPADWRTLAATAQALLEIGEEPKRLTELLAPLADSPGLIHATPELRDLLARAGKPARDEPDDEELSPRRSAEVERVAELLQGRRMVFVGGERRPEAARALEEAFGLESVEWIELAHHASILPARPAIARPETAVVILAIRWASHSFEGIKEFCAQYGKPFVRLPGGYNPSAVAHHILEQVEAQLTAGSAK